MATSTTKSCASTKGKIAIIGTGLIGRSWAAIFARAGYTVSMYDIDSKQFQIASEVIQNLATDWEKEGWLRMNDKIEDVVNRVTFETDLQAAVKDAVYLQECVPEKLEMKQAIFSQLDTLVNDTTILASSASCIGPSKFTSGLNNKNRCIVAHPTNPPYYCTLVEVVPAPYTDKDVTSRVIKMLNEIGLSPVLVNNELNGFASNRLQYAIIMEAWRLVEDGVCSPEDLDVILTEGIGMRYSFMGVFETMQLNADGARNYCERYGAGISSVVEEQQNVRSLSGETLDKVEKYLNSKLPLDKLDERRKWRDEWLKAITREKIKMRPFALQNL